MATPWGGGGGALGFEWIPTAQRPHGAEAVNAKRIAKFDMKVGSQRTTKLYIWLSSSLFWSPSFVTLLYVCGISCHTAVFIGKRKIT